jgi:hypothetical protein
MCRYPSQSLCLLSYPGCSWNYNTQHWHIVAVLGVRGPRFAIPAVSVVSVWDTPVSVAVDSDSESCAVRLDW